MLIDIIKKDQLNARKNKDKSAMTLTTLIGEAEKIGKDNGNRKSTDEEVITVIKKFIKGLDEFHENVKDENKKKEIKEEISWIDIYLPKQLTENEISDIVSIYVTENEISGNKAIGIVMKFLKEQYSGQYDGKVASTIIKGMIS